MRSRLRLMVVGAAMAVAMLPATAFATEPPATDAAITDAFDSIETTVQTVAVPALLSLAVIVTIAMVALRWVRKARSSAA